MDLFFEIGDRNSPKGHALLYFVDSLGHWYATYIVLLPVTVDVSKYVPPFLMNQVGEFGPGDMSAIAFPPAPEKVASLDEIKDLAAQRSDDLINGGVCDMSDVTSAMSKVNDVVESYLELYSDELFVREEITEVSGNPDDAINDVVYAFMSQPDRLNELTKLVGKIRFAVEGNAMTMLEETEMDIRTLSTHLPDGFQIDDLLKWALGSGVKADKLTELYLRRCYHLSLEEYGELGEVEAKINEIRDS